MDNSIHAGGHTISRRCRITVGLSHVKPSLDAAVAAYQLTIDYRQLTIIHLQLSIIKQTIKIATCQFAEDWSHSRNGSIMCRHIERAAGMGAEVVHFHECALSGYGGKI